MTPRSWLLEFAERQGAMILDGGLATTLEAGGYDLDDPLWSARVLVEAPHTLEGVHRSFLDAGADCIASATYQATTAGFMARGLTSEDAEGLLRKGVRIARDARDAFWSDHGSVDAPTSRRLRPLVAASVGPYGAYLADGSEYRGAYGVDREELYDFHRSQWDVLVESGADLMACETIPSGLEVEVLLQLVHETPGTQAWISLSCRDQNHLADGTSLREVARLCDRVPGVVGVGVNCVAPSAVSGILDALHSGTEKPKLAYPNSGESYEPAGKSWHPGAEPEEWQERAQGWLRQGAIAIGGCCRTTPADVARLRTELLS